MPDPDKVLAPDRRRRFADLINEIGFTAACDRIKVSRETGARLIGGLPVRYATAFSACASLDALPPSRASRVNASTDSSNRPVWLDRWAEAHLTVVQREALERYIAEYAPAWSRAK